MRSLPRLVLLFPCVAVAMLAARASGAADDPLPEGGLLVHVGCGAGGRTVKFVEQGEWLVHGLDGDWQNVEKAHKLIQQKALYGLVSVDRWAGRELPYADNIVNVLVVEQQGSVTEKEIMRVLAPLGVARLQGRTIRKPRPKGMDEWPHRRHGADGNPVSRDTLVGPPREIRWVLGRGNYGLP
ncbi:MAG: class I SAM-dependent methyltransferase, partial [Planctomycetota bacterium]